MLAILDIKAETRAFVSCSRKTMTKKTKLTAEEQARRELRDRYIDVVARESEAKAAEALRRRDQAERRERS